MAERSPEQKEHALAVYVEHGLAEAHRQTGIPKPTLHDWARRAGLDPSVLAAESGKLTLAATEARQVRCEAMRAELRERLLETAGTLLDRVDHPYFDVRGKDAERIELPTPPPAGCRDYVVAAAVLIDKYRLETGEVTERAELLGAGADEARLGKIIELVAERRAS